ncbi:restriction endonuclease subunit S [Caldifermentibacillus hisashii]|jgi:type I restriction enzyme S subunit|uniref:restriction endonuclease subunit S n=1 Tax=Caldifermentibacillus hisashii TaxID=996558 RepID=UPI0030D643A9
MVKIQKVSEVCEIIMGQSPPSDSYNDKGIGMPFFQGKSEFGELNPTPKWYCSSPIRLAEVDDILISVRAPVGDVNIANVNCCIGRGLAAIRPDKTKLLTKFLFYVLKGKKREIENMGTGSTFKAISKKDLVNIKIPVPNIEIQKKIVNTFDKAQELIDKRKAQIEALDQLTQSVFLEMFGDPLANSKGWPTVKLKDYICKITKINLKQNKDIIKYIDISSIDNYKNKITSYKEYIGSEAPSRAQQVVQKGDILISTVRPNLKNVAMVQDNFENLICSTGFCVIRCTDKLNNNFIFHLVKSDSFTKNLVRKTTGANYPAVKNSDIYDEIIIYPPIDLQEKFSNITKQIEEKKTFLENSLPYQEKLFNSILQKAFNGELFTEEKVSNF